MNSEANTPTSLATAIHLDAVGGIAGDMFAAAILDALPSAWPACERAIKAMTPPPHVSTSIDRHTDGILTGSKFNVIGAEEHDHGGHSHAHEHDTGHAHHHHSHTHHRWRDIRHRLETANLLAGERKAAISIFSHLAVAEAAVHGIEVDDVAFHEVGAWDSIIDIVAAAALISQLPGCTWSVSSLPRGRGFVKTAHGVLAVPAPATVELLKGYTVHDDGEDGERITPTGAAILAYLAPSQTPDPTPRRLMTSGTGFGTRRFRQRSNILRATFYSDDASHQNTDTVVVLRCEIDDQTPEDLAIALEKIRANKAVLDACQWPVFGKKGRMAIAVQVLVRQDNSAEVVQLILDETTTLGVRRTTMHRDVIERDQTTVDGVRVKRAVRPSAITAKAESDDVASIGTHNARQAARHHAEKQTSTHDVKNGQIKQDISGDT